ncbi:MAG: ribose-phosphate pyrophosphokinase [Sphingomicrobium sp.]
MSGEKGAAAGLLADPDEVRAILVASARAGQAISYSEVLGLLGHRFSRPKMRALCSVLAFVDDDAGARGEPELAVLVVRQSDGLPGQGWWIGGAKAHGYNGLWEGPKAAKLIHKLHAATFAYWAGRSG